MSDPYDDDNIPSEYLNVTFMPPPADHKPAGPKDRKRKPRTGWANGWQLNEVAEPLCNFHNAMVAMRFHPKLKELVGYDQMAGYITVLRPVPNVKSDAKLPRALKDVDVLGVQEEMQRCGLRRIARQVVQDAVDAAAHEAAYHPVRQYLDGLVWDGVPRVSSWLSTYLGAEPGPYSERIGEMVLCSMAARIYEPGCKADYMVIFQGEQGILKSKACSILAGPWYSDNLPDLSTSDPVRLSMHLRGKWVIEVAEMSAFSAAAAAHLKRFVSQQVERFTPKYGRAEVHEPRQCIFFGTTNEGAYLRDSTGARRFWPMLVLWVDQDGLERDRDQLLAEAVVRYRAGVPWWPDRAFEERWIKPEQEDRYEGDPWEERIKGWLEGGAAVDRFGQPVLNAFGIQETRERVDETTASTLIEGAVGMPVGQQSVRETRRAGAVLVAMGWTQKRSKSARVYSRPKSDH